MSCFYALPLTDFYQTAFHCLFSTKSFLCGSWLEVRAICNSSTLAVKFALSCRDTLYQGLHFAEAFSLASFKGKGYRLDPISAKPQSSPVVYEKSSNAQFDAGE